MDEQRKVRLRKAVRILNRERKNQRKKIDILCNDIIASHKDFISNMRNLKFAADFYEAMLGSVNLEDISRAAGEFLAGKMPGLCCGIILATSSIPQIHFYSNNRLLDDVPSQISGGLTAKLIEMVCRGDGLCTSDALCRMDFFASPAVLKKVSLAAIGLNSTGTPLGMLILCKPAEQPLDEGDFEMVLSITGGLSKAVEAARKMPACDSFA